MPPTPQYTWPLINQRLSTGLRLGTEAWIKHENHTPVGAFKLRGALVYLDWLKTTQPEVTGVVAATRGNHGQGVGMAARLFDLKAVVVVPWQQARRRIKPWLAAKGSELVEYGQEFFRSPWSSLAPWLRSVAFPSGFLP